MQYTTTHPEKLVRNQPWSVSASEAPGAQHDPWKSTLRAAVVSVFIVLSVRKGMVSHDSDPRLSYQRNDSLSD